jgi:hypothetical protein
LSPHGRPKGEFPLGGTARSSDGASVSRLATPVRSATAAWAAAGLLLTLGGCADVAPWERGILARPQMALNPAPLRHALLAHVQSSREAAPASDPAEGGGCGCY